MSRVASARLLLGEHESPSRCLLPVIFAYVCSFSTTLPLFLDGRSILYCCVAAIPLSVFIYAVLLLLSRVSLCVQGDRFKGNLRLFLFAAGSLMVVWGIAFLVLFPGCFSTDSNDILKMVWGMPFESSWFRYGALNSHHPAFYVFLNYLAVRLGELLGFGQMGCASIAAFMHAVTLACCCGFVVCEANNLFGKRLVVLFCWAFFFFDPLLTWYSVTVWKDVVFSGTLLCFSMLLVEAFLRPDDFAAKRWKAVLLVVFAVASSLLRSNGFIAIGLSLLVACFAMSGLARKTMVRLTACVVALFFVVAGPVYGLAHVAPAHFSETVGVPLQQISRTVHEGGTISEEDEAYLSKLLPMDEWRDSYSPGTPNPLKFSDDFNDSVLEEDKLRFVLCWIEIGIENPGCYLRAWIAQTRDYWSLDSNTWYTVTAGYDLGYGKEANGHLGQILTSEDLEVALSSVIEAFSFLFSIGFLAWSMLGGLLIGFLKGHRRSLMFFLPFVSLWATFLLAAPAADFRYMLSLHLAFPLFFLFAFWDFDAERKGSLV